MKNGHELKIDSEKHKELKITDVRTRNVTRNKMDRFEHKMVRMKHVSLSNHWQNMH